MNTKNEYICPICGEGTLWTDFTDGFKWGRAYCDRCDCGGPEVRTGYDENIDAPWRADAIKLFVDVVNEHVSKRKNPCDSCIGPALAISHGYEDMRIKPKVEE